MVSAPERARRDPAAAARTHARAHAGSDPDAHAGADPAPTFDTAAAAPTPVPTIGQVLHETARRAGAIKPFPVVRMRGRLTTTGRRVTLLSVSAPRAAKISVRCKGACPTQALVAQPAARAA